MTTETQTTDQSRDRQQAAAAAQEGESQDTNQNQGLMSEEDMWAAMETEEAGGAPEPEPESDDDEGEREDEGEDAGEAEAPDDESSEESEAEPEPESEPEPETDADRQARAQTEGTEAAPGSGDDEEPAWWKELPGEAKEQLQAWDQQMRSQFNQMQQQYQSLHGKVAPVQRQAEEFRRENAELKKRLENFESATPKDVEELEKLNGYKEWAQDFPEDARALKEAVGNLVRKTRTEAQEQINSLKQGWSQDRQRTVLTEQQTLAQFHPDFREWNQSPIFREWLNVQPTDVQQMYASQSALPNYLLLNMFKQDLAEAQKAAGQPQTKQPAGKPSQSSQTSKTAARKPPSPSPPSQGSGISPTSAPNEPVNEQEEWVKQWREELRSA